MKIGEESRQVKISGPLLIALHLAPGLIFGGVFFVFSWKFIGYGLTGYLALLATIPVCPFHKAPVQARQPQVGVEGNEEDPTVL